MPADAYETVRPAILLGGLSARGLHVTGQTAGPIWPSASPPEATAALHWALQEVAELPRVRAELRRHATGAAGDRWTPTSWTS